MNNGGIEMSTISIVFIVLCVLLFIGILALDLYISHDLKKPENNDKQNNDDVNKVMKN